jgi:RimJ/RimL family protein N-acetyltransferase
MDPVVLPLEREGYALREFADEDIFPLCRLADNYEVWRWLSDLFPRPYDEAAARRWLEEQLNYDPPRNLALVGPDGLVGGLGLNLTDAPNRRHDGEVGYWLGQPYWGRGLMTTALPAFLAWAAPAHGLSRFTAHVYGGNDASVRVLERCGFQREGVMRGAVIKEGQVLDQLVFGRLA